MAGNLDASCRRAFSTHGRRHEPLWAGDSGQQCPPRNPLADVQDTTGLRMARQRRLVEHRRWMIRSFALTMSIITNRVWAVIATIVLMPQLRDHVWR